MLVVRCAAVSGISVAGGVTGVVSSLLTTSLFFISSSCSSWVLCFPTLVPLNQTSFDFCSSSSADLCLLLK